MLCGLARQNLAKARVCQFFCPLRQFCLKDQSLRVLAMAHHSAEAKLKEKGVVLPEASAPAFSYVHCVRTGNQLWISGQIPRLPNKEFLHNGKLGKNVTVEQGQEAARLCVINGLAQARAALGGSLEHVVRVIKVVGFVASAEGFTSQPQVINGASDFLIEIFGEHGKHARSAVGVFELPLGVSVEVEMVLEVK